MVIQAQVQDKGRVAGNVLLVPSLSINRKLTMSFLPIFQGNYSEFMVNGFTNGSFISYFPLFSPILHEISIAHANTPFFFILIMHMRLCARHMNMHFTRTLGTVVTKTRPPWNIVLITEYDLSPLDRFLVIRMLRRMLSTGSFYLFRDLSMVASIPLPSTPKYPLYL